MKTTYLFLAASFTLTIAGGARADETRFPTTSDEARVHAAQRDSGASVQPPASGCAQVPTTTDQARAAAGARIAAGTVATSSVGKSRSSARPPSSTDEARAFAAAPMNASVLVSGDRHEEVCASCACKPGEEHVRATVDRCGCHNRT
jgi:hypothetical protein